ncbi:MAG TPA: AbiV family abortive infection protein [Thiobacillus sp.]
MGLTVYKYKRLATESLRNALRLHADSIFLYRSGSFPSAFQLAVLALEEFSKAKWIEHYYYSSITNEGFPGVDFEQQWLTLLYSHPEKQYHFVAQDLFGFSPKLVRFIQSKKLEEKKQQAVYVGLKRNGKRIDTTSRVSTPARIKESDAKQIISLVNQELVDIFTTIEQSETYFGIAEMDELIYPDLRNFLFAWPHRSGLKSRARFLKQHIAEIRGEH